jgi:outer membrane receptor protein involved in Fe transport
MTVPTPCNVADSAPYLDLTWDLAGLQLEGSLRHDDYQVSGWTQSASANQIGCLSGGTFSAPLASGNCASLTTPLVSYMVTDQSTYAPLNYGVNYNSWSFGALYQFDSNTSVYGRASRGGKVNTDRNILSGYNNPDGSLNYADRWSGKGVRYNLPAGSRHQAPGAGVRR